MHLLEAEQAGLWRLSTSVCFCVYPGLLLLCMIASEVWDAETKPIEFVCNKGARRAMNIVAEMKSALVRICVFPNISLSVFSLLHLILLSVCCYLSSAITP